MDSSEPKEEKTTESTEEERLEKIKKIFGIEREQEEKNAWQNVSEQDISRLLDELCLDPTQNLHDYRCILLRSTDNVTITSAMRIFGKYNPLEIRLVNSFSAIIHLESPIICAAALLDVSKPLRRIKYKVIDDDIEEDEEEGMIINNKGDPVVIVTCKKNDPKLIKRHNKEDDFVEVDVDRVGIPEGAWRVTKHTTNKVLVLCTFASDLDFKEARENKLEIWKSSRKKVIPSNDIFSRITKIGTEGDTKISFSREKNDEMNNDVWRRDKTIIREGLNIFNKQGEELDFDFEHCVRTFVNPENDNVNKRKIGEEKDDKKDDEPATKKVRGRGACKFKSGIDN
uniref:PITH domain-containing protein n=1 Tax=Strongyloides papillosus TaxID=174720 RepID=A0A0N5BT11_STREA